jgi:YbbR domain-containing protein
MIRRLFMHDFGWKLASLVVAVLLWFSIIGEQEVVTTRPAPILYQNLSRDLLIGTDALDSVRLELRGPASKLTADRLAAAEVQVDLSSVNGPGERTFTLSGADLRLPEGVSFLRAVPSQLRVRFARMMTREVPVEVRIGEPPPAGYRVARQEVTPDRLSITGPEARVTTTQKAETDALDLSSVTDTAEIRVNTFIADPQVRLESPPMVTVRVTVEKTN